MKPEILEQLTWHDLDEIIEADNELGQEAKDINEVHGSFPRWAKGPKRYYTELLKLLKAKQ